MCFQNELSTCTTLIPTFYISRRYLQKHHMSKRTWPSRRHTRNPGICIFALSWNSQKHNFRYCCPLKLLSSGTHLPTAPWRNHGNLRVPEYHHPKTFLRDYIIWTTMIRYWGTLIKIPMMKAPRSADAFSFTFAFMAFAFSIAIALDSFTTLSTWTAIHRPGAQGDHWWRTGERDLFLP